MKTAKEWLDEMRGTAELVEPSVESILARDIEGLEEAAKLICAPCGDGRHPTLDAYKRRWHSGADCKAWAIHDRIAELKKEQGQ